MRVQVEIRKDFLDEVDRIREAHGIHSRADAIRAGIRIFKWVVDCRLAGDEVMVRAKNGTTKDIIFLFPFGSGA